MSVVFEWPSGPNEVIVTGTFDAWSQQVALIKGRDGRFSIEVPMVTEAEDRVEFKFIVDGKWVVSDDYWTVVDEEGNVNNYIEVGAGGVKSKGFEINGDVGKTVIPESGLMQATHAEEPVEEETAEEAAAEEESVEEETPVAPAPIEVVDTAEAVEPVDAAPTTPLTPTTESVGSTKKYVKRVMKSRDSSVAAVAPTADAPTESPAPAAATAATPATPAPASKGSETSKDGKTKKKGLFSRLLKKL